MTDRQPPTIDVEQLRHNVVVKQLELRAAIEALTAETKEPFTPWAPHLPTDLISNCRVLPSRYHIIELMPKNGVCVEIGSQAGNFAHDIMTKTRPKEMHIIDADLSPFQKHLFETELAGGTIHLHEGESSEIMSSFPNEKFDWVYIDADHTYAGFVKDIEQAALKVKPHGFIVCNDYTVWSPGEVLAYGVLKGVHEFCVKHRWEFAYLGLHGQGYHDICIRKRP